MIASLIDTTAIVATRSDASHPDKICGTTVSYLTAAAEKEDLQATAHVLRRRKNRVYLDVEMVSLPMSSALTCLPRTINGATAHDGVVVG